MNFEEFYTFCALKGIVSERKLIDVTPLGAQYRIVIRDESFHCSVFYREINNKLIMVSNGIRRNVRESNFQIERDLSTIELFNIMK